MKPPARPPAATTTRPASLTVAALAAALCGAGFHRAFALRDLAGPVVLAAVAPVALVGLITARRRGRPLALPASLALSALAWLGVVAATLFRHGSPQASGVLPAVHDGLVDGWARLLDTTLPAAATPDLVVVPQLLTWVAAALGAELVVRTRGPLLPVLPAVAGFTAAVALTVPAPGSDVPVAAALLAAAGLMAMARRAGEVGGRRGDGAGEDDLGPVQPGAGRGARSVLLGAAVTAAVAGAGLLVGPVAPTVRHRSPYDLRAHRTEAQHPAAAVSPLDAASGWLAGADAAFFRVQSAGARPNLRLAVFDRFDGETWTSSEHFIVAGTRVPPEPAGPARPARVRQDVTIVGLGGTFLPAADRPVGLDGQDLEVDTRDGSLLSRVPLRPGRTYSVVSAPPVTLSAAQYAALGYATGPEADADRALPSPPEAVADLARVAAAGTTTPFQRAYALQQYILRSFSLDRAAPGGHAYGNLADFVGRTHAGTAEQFATLYAVVGRFLGMPTRVVVGFQPPAGPGAVVVGANDTRVWAEVDFAGAGWIPFPTTPDRTNTHKGGVATSAQGQSIDQAEKLAQAAAQPTATRTVTAPAAAAPAGGTPVAVMVLLIIGAAVAVALVAGLLAIVVAPAVRRRRRRRAPGNRDKVVGAWLDTLDALDLAGAPVSRAATATEAVARATETVGGGVGVILRPLADLATSALCGPDEPADRDVEAAWEFGGSARAQIRRATPARRRVQRRFSPRRIAGARPDRASGLIRGRR